MSTMRQRSLLGSTALVLPSLELAAFPAFGVILILGGPFHTLLLLCLSRCLRPLSFIVYGFLPSLGQLPHTGIVGLASCLGQLAQDFEIIRQDLQVLRIWYASSTTVSLEYFVIADVGRYHQAADWDVKVRCVGRTHADSGADD